MLVYSAMGSACMFARYGVAAVMMDLRRVLGGKQDMDSCAFELKHKGYSIDEISCLIARIVRQDCAPELYA